MYTKELGTQDNSPIIFVDDCKNTLCIKLSFESRHDIQLLSKGKNDLVPDSILEWVYV